MKTVTFTRSIAIRGEHHEAGSTATLEDSIVAEAINAGDAVLAEPAADKAEKPAKPEKAK